MFLFLPLILGLPRGQSLAGVEKKERGEENAPPPWHTRWLSATVNHTMCFRGKASCHTEISRNVGYDRALQLSISTDSQMEVDHNSNQLQHANHPLAEWSADCRLSLF